MPKIRRTVTEVLDLPTDVLIDLDALLGEGYVLANPEGEADDDLPDEDAGEDDEDDADEDEDDDDD